MFVFHQVLPGVSSAPGVRADVSNVCCPTDEQLLGLMKSICALVDSIPEHELIGLSCGNELLLKRAQRCVRLGAKKYTDGSRSEV